MLNLRFLSLFGFGLNLGCLDCGCSFLFDYGRLVVAFGLLLRWDLVFLCLGFVGLSV